MPMKRDQPYIWVTWLTRFLTGGNSCEFSPWFRAQHETDSYKKRPSTFDAVAWNMNHTKLLRETTDRLRERGDSNVAVEGQNAFTLKGKVATLGGKPDIITVSGGAGEIIDVKSGAGSPSNDVQVMLYMFAVTRALTRYDGVEFSGRVIYPDHETRIQAKEVDAAFIQEMSDLIRRLASPEAPIRIPSRQECAWCPLTEDDCPERLFADTVEEGQTDAF